MLHFKAPVIKVKHYQQYDNINFDYPIFAIFPDDPAQSLWTKLPYGQTLYTRWQKEQLSMQNNSDQNALISNLSKFSSQLPNEQGTPINIVNLKPAKSTFQKLELFRNQIVSLTKNKPEAINILLYNFDVSSEEEILDNIIVCLGGHYTVLPKISQKNDYAPNCNLTVHCHGISQLYNHNRALAEIKGNGLTRFLCNLPANHLYPETYREYVHELANLYGWKYEFIDQNQLKQKQAGAYLAVVQGSTRKDAGIVKLTYKPSDLSEKKVALVGKGMCFDTGGHNLKTPLGSMYGMSHDMTGSAVALGSLLALTELQVPFNVEAWLALAENDISPEAYKPGDVVFASNGLSIEVINTDAEGRMVLADTLFFASESEPNLVMDYATLTGSCVRALDELYSGLVTNQYHWNSALMDIGQKCGERVWPFPFTEDYDEVLKSDIADTKQCHEGSADQIRAARFLGKFIYNNTPWVHIDLSSHAHKGGLGHINTDTTGFGVRFTLSLLLDHDLVI